MGPSFAISVSDDDTTVFMPTNIGFTGAEVSQSGSGVIVDITAASGAPSDVDYLVGTADATLTNEIVVGTTPGGELGNTWPSPTVDATHSGSAHHTASTECSTSSCDLNTSTTLNTQGICLADGTDCPAGGAGTITRVGDVTSGESLVTGGNITADDVTIASGGSIIFSSATSTIAGIQNQNLVDKTAVETITRGWVIDGTADENQLRLQGHSTQTSDIFVVENSGGTDTVSADDVSMKVSKNFDAASLVQFSALTDCETIATDSSGIARCDTDDGGAEVNNLETITTDIAINEVPTGTGADTAVYKLLPDCNVAGSALNYEDSTQTWSCRSGLGGGASKFTWTMRPQQAKLPTTAPMGIDAGAGRWKGTLDDTVTDESGNWETVLFPFGGGTLQAKIFYTVETTTSSDVAAFDLLIECKSDTDASFDSDSFGTTNSIDSPSQSLTAGVLDVLTDTSLNEDSCAEYDHITVKVFRDVSSDGVIDDIFLRKVTIEEL